MRTAAGACLHAGAGGVPAETGPDPPTDSRCAARAAREGLRLRLSYDRAAAVEVRELVALERACCGFLDFQLQEHGDRLVVTITAPAEVKDAIEEILSEFAGEPGSA